MKRSMGLNSRKFINYSRLNYLMSLAQILTSVTLLCPKNAALMASTEQRSPVFQSKNWNKILFLQLTWTSQSILQVFSSVSTEKTEVMAFLLSSSFDFPVSGSGG